jgi:isopentenyl-diphosphate delta-isomerase
MHRLNNTGIQALDVSGFGGTHWGRIEGLRTHDESQKRAAITFQNWGINTLTALQSAKSLDLDYEIWGSGGIRSGLDCAKLISLGAKTFGFARPMLAAAIEGIDPLTELMKTIEFELKTALFCTGHSSIRALEEDKYAMLQP